MLLLFLLIYCKFHYGLPLEDLIRIEEKLTTDKNFYKQWMQLISLQAEQLEEQSLNYPLSVSSLNSCSLVPPTNMDDSSNSLRPSSIAFYADIGHMSVYCKSNYTMLHAGLLDSCDHRSISMKLPSLDKMLRIFNPNLTVIRSNEPDDKAVEQARAIADSIKEHKGYKNVWKLIVIAASIQDGEASESGQTAVEVLETVEELHKLLPTKTFIVVVRTSGHGIWRDASRSHMACEQLLSGWKTRSKYHSTSVWDQMETIVQKNFRRSEFTVEVLPLMSESALTDYPEHMDLSVLGYDCAHFSERGLSLLHIAIWNSIFTKSSDRIRQFRPVAPPLLCPDFRCPFLRTVTNSDYCIWKAPQAAPKASIYPKLIAICLLLICLLLASMVVFFMCRKPRRTDDIKKPAQAFGASLSSIKFIDEDVV